MITTQKALYIDSLDFSRELFGSGGSTVGASAIREMSQAFIFIGYSSDPDHFIGKINKCTLYGKTFLLLPIGRPISNKSILPGALRFLLLLVIHYNSIQKLQIKNVFTRLYTALWFFAFSTKWNTCFYAPGLGNPMLIGRHHLIGRVFAPLYSLIQSKAIGRTSITFAAASRNEVISFEALLKKHNVSTKVHVMPTGVNTDLFAPIDITLARRSLNIANNTKVFVFVGRLAKVKGISFLIDSFCIFNSQEPNSLFLIVGNGEEESFLHNYSNNTPFGKNIIFLGKKSPSELISIIAAANACIIGSHTEGFSLAMLEQASCGKPIVTTAVSGASDILTEGVNGYIVNTRDAKLFAKKMAQACRLTGVQDFSRELVVANYSEKSLWNRIRILWQAINDL